MFIFHVIGSLFNSEEPQGFGYSQVPQCQEKLDRVETLRLKAHSLYQPNKESYFQSSEFKAVRKEFIKEVNSCPMSYKNPITYLSF